MKLSISKEPRIGSYRLVKFFPIIPRRTNSEEMVFLELCWAIQEYRDYGDYGNGWAGIEFFYKEDKDKAERRFEQIRSGYNVDYADGV